MRMLFGLAASILLAAPTAVFAQHAPLGLHGIKIAVSDYDRATRFYAILGMTPGTKYGPSEWELRWVEPARGSIVIMVKDESGRMGVTKGGGSLMINVADIAATVARLNTAGFATPGKPFSIGGVTIMMLKDPDGNTVELFGGPFGESATPAH